MARYIEAGVFFAALFFLAGRVDATDVNFGMKIHCDPFMDTCYQGVGEGELDLSDENNFPAYQEFKSDTVNRVYKVKLHLRGSSTEEITIQIKDSDGMVLDTASAEYNVPGWLEFEFSPPVEITPEVETYRIEHAQSTGDVRAVYTEPGEYTSGRAVIGGVYEDDIDFHFQIWGCVEIEEDPPEEEPPPGEEEPPGENEPPEGEEPSDEWDETPLQFLIQRITEVIKEVVEDRTRIPIEKIEEILKPEKNGSSPSLVLSVLAVGGGLVTVGGVVYVIRKRGV